MFQLNPLRCSKRRKPQPFFKVKQPFDQDAFNFTKIQTTELLFNISIEHVSILIIWLVAILITEHSSLYEEIHLSLLFLWFFHLKYINNEFDKYCWLIELLHPMWIFSIRHQSLVLNIHFKCLGFYWKEWHLLVISTILTRSMLWNVQFFTMKLF